MNDFRLDAEPARDIAGRSEAGGPNTVSIAGDITHSTVIAGACRIPAAETRYVEQQGADREDVVRPPLTQTKRGEVPYVGDEWDVPGTGVPPSLRHEVVTHDQCHFGAAVGREVDRQAAPGELRDEERLVVVAGEPPDVRQSVG